MALGTTNISTDLVGTTLSTSSRDVGTLCTHSAINKWSKYKPVRSNSVIGLTETGFQAARFGLERDNSDNINYLKPTGEQTSPYRLGDFRGYNHTAIPPTNVTIYSVKELASNSMLSTPYTLIKGFSYEIGFIFEAGEIDPIYINSKTSRTKITGQNSGYGGIALKPPYISTDTAVDDADIHNVPSSPYITITPTVAGDRPFDIYYCNRVWDLGTGVNAWAQPYVVEDRKYRDLFTVVNIDMTISADITKNIDNAGTDFSVVVTNGTGRQFTNVYIEYKYRTNNKPYNITSDIVTLNNGINNLNETVYIGDLDNGDNTIELIFTVKIMSNEVASINVGEVINYQLI